MEEFPPTLDLPPAAPSVPRTSLAARLLNIVAMPGLVFAEIKAARHMAGNWLVPTLIAGIVAMAGALVLVSQPTFQSQIQERFNQQLKTMDGQVKSGELSRADADRIIALMNTVAKPAVLKICATAGALVASVARLFGWAFVLWLINLWFLKVQFTYLKAMEVAGLASLIAVVGTIVSLLLIVNLDGSFSTTVASNSARKDDLLTGVSAVFNFWYLGVMGCGLARLTGVSFPRAMFPILTFWLLLLFLLSSLGVTSL